MQDELIAWYRVHHRHFPWREDQEPYHIWISEIMLQQTTTETVIPYYQRFMARFPDVNSLALASEEEVYKMWEGLGYYRRARHLHESAKIIVEQYEGKFPHEYEAIRALKGIGDYTAGAISSIAFQQQVPAVDGNVLRIISRVYMIKDNIALSKTQKKIYQIVAHLLTGKDASAFNQGLMENDTVEICGRTLKAAYPECVEGCIQMSYSESNMGLLVVPDDLPLTEQDVFQSCLISDYTPEYDNRDFYSWMDDGGFEEQINAGLTDTESGSGQEDQGVVQISTRSRIYDDSIGSSAMAVFIALYLGFVFIVSGAAILALKEMSDAIDSRGKYRILRQLGAEEKEVNRALVIQMGIFFGFPLLLAAVHSVFGIQVSYTMLGIYASVDSLPPLIIAAVLIGILYGGYFAVSYLCCRRVIGE